MRRAGANDTSGDVSRGFSSQFNTKYSDFMKKGSQQPQRRGNLEVQPLHEQGQQILSVCQEVLRHYKSTNALGKGTDLELDIRPNDQDKRDVLEIINRGRQLGEKIINAAVSPSAGDSPLTPVQSSSSTDELVASFFETSLARTGETAKGKGTWGLWMALDKVVKLLEGEAI